MNVNVRLEEILSTLTRGEAVYKTYSTIHGKEVWNFGTFSAAGKIEHILTSNTLFELAVRIETYTANK